MVNGRAPWLLDGQMVGGHIFFGVHMCQMMSMAAGGANRIYSGSLCGKKLICLIFKIIIAKNITLNGFRLY